MTESNPYTCTRDIAWCCIRTREGYGDLFKAGALERIIKKCTPFYYSPSCVNHLEEAVKDELMWQPLNRIDRIEECTGGYKVLVGWQEWGLFRDEQP